MKTPALSLRGFMNSPGWQGCATIPPAMARDSRNTPLAGPIVVPVVGITATLILSVPYGYIAAYVPWVLYKVAMPVLYGFAIALVITFAGSIAKCRDGGLLRLIGFICSLLAVYAGWSVFVFALIQQGGEGGEGTGMIEIFLQPMELWQYVVGHAEGGWETVLAREWQRSPRFGWMSSSVFSWVLWGLEATVIVVLGTYCCAVLPTASVTEGVRSKAPG